MQEPDGSLFDRMRNLLISGDLKDFAANWQGNNTGFKLDQLATLHGLERRSAREVTGRSTSLIVKTGLCVGMWMVAWTGFVLYLRVPSTQGLSYASAPLQCAIGVVLWWVGSVCFVIGTFQSRFEREFNRGPGPVYEAELERFAAALRVALNAFGIELIRDLISMGRKNVAQLAGTLLLEALMEIEKLSAERDRAKTTEEAIAIGATVSEKLEQFQVRFQAFSDLKFETRTYDRIFAEARERIKQAA